VGAREEVAVLPGLVVRGDEQIGCERGGVARVAEFERPRADMARAIGHEAEILDCRACLARKSR